MSKVEVLFFDVLGTVVDWRGSITEEVRSFLNHQKCKHIDAAKFADAWVGRYDASAERVRTGKRAFVSLDVLNMENLEACVAEFELRPPNLQRTDLENLNQAWHRLKPWPDSAAGLMKLKKSYIVAPLSDGHTRLLVDMAKQAQLPWDVVLGADIFKAYKPMPQVYLGACDLLGVAPENAMLVTAHDYDLSGAKQCGLKTAYVIRDHANDPSMVDKHKITDEWDYTAKGLIELAEIL